MIWLSAVSEESVVSVYFDIRHIEVTLSGTGPEVLVRGLLGDGYCENWGEVSLGKTEEVVILPSWNDSGMIESLSAVVDESILQQEMLTAAQSYVEDCFSVLPQSLNNEASGHQRAFDLEERIAA